MKFIIGKKSEMTQIWKDGESVAVTKVIAGPCTVVQVKNEEKDGYKAIQIAYGERKEKNIKKPQKGHTKGLGNFQVLREFRSEADVENVKRGDVVDVSTFEAGDTIQVTSVSKGRGFQGVVKRYGFKGAIKTHGTKDQVRMPGSIGATGPAHVFKGTRMGGRMGGDKVTIKNLEVIEVDVENNILLVRGGIPGSKNTTVLISGDGELKIQEIKEEVKKEEKVEEPKDEKKEETVEEKKVEDKDSSKEEKEEAVKEKKA